jgi:uncharacterized protein YndB with AHSA1/START domain
MADDTSPRTEARYCTEIDASLAVVWDALTNPEFIRRWMLDTEMEIISDWQVGRPIVFRGELNGHRFENRGTIRAFEPATVFEYDYWSSLSRSKVPDRPENYTTVRFELEGLQRGTKLTVFLSNFVDESIYRHVKFYWNGTLPVLKRFCEERRGIQNPSV